MESIIINNPNFYILRIGDGTNFKNSAPKQVWGVRSSQCKTMIRELNFGDILCFVSNNDGKVVAFASFVSYNKRENGELLDLTLSNAELGWGPEGSNYDLEIHYKDLYNT